MSTVTFDEVLVSAAQLPLEDQMRLRDALPLSSSDHVTIAGQTERSPGSPFRRLAGIINEPPQDCLSEEDQAIYGQS